MDHNIGFTDGEDVDRYMKRDESVHCEDEVPYAIRRDDVVGRHMVAVRDIKPGETIFVESPLTFGPSEHTVPICLGCCDIVVADSPCCSGGCGYPMCSKECSQIPQHAVNECKLFREHGYKLDRQKLTFGKVNEFSIAYAVISAIRTLLLRRRNDPKWELVWMLMSHQDKRKKSTYWSRQTNNVIGALKESIGLQDPEEVHIVEVILGIHLVNDFEITPYRGSQELGYESTEGGQSIRGLFALASMPSHSCVANATHDFSKREAGFKMTMRAVVGIAKGADITHAYTEPLDPVLTRRSLLRVGKFFDCNCIRCSDNTELGLYTSAVICSGCEGNVVSSDAADLEADWKCENCNGKIPCSEVVTLLAKIKREAEHLDTRPNVEDYEAFVQKHSGKTLHPNHVFLIDKLYSLAKMYGRMEGYEADALSDAQLRRKLQLCQTVMKVLDNIMPGRMRKRAMMMYEMHVPLVMLSNKALQRGPSSGADPEKIKADLKTALFNLRMSLEILKSEPEGSFEAKIVEGSKVSVAQLDGWVDTVCSSL